MIELRNFKSWEVYAWQGANDFSDGSKPLIAEGKEALLIVCGSEIGDESAVVDIYFGEDCNSWGFKSYDSKEDAIKDAKLFTNLLDDEIDVNQLQRFGFVVVC